MATQTVTVSLPEELVQGLDRVAAETHSNRAELMEQALASFLNDTSELDAAGTSLAAYHLACIQEGIRQADAGMTSPMDEAMERIRRRVQEPEDDGVRRRLSRCRVRVYPLEQPAECTLGA